MLLSIEITISEKLSLTLLQVRKTISLLKDGATIPFIARYRKELTGSLDEVKVKEIKSLLDELEALAARKDSILKSIQDQGKLTPGLEMEINDSVDKQQLEDIYLPYKQRKKTKADIAIEKGLLPLANIFFLQQLLDEDKDTLLQNYVDIEKGVNSTEEATQGAMQIIAQRISDQVSNRQWIRKFVLREGSLCTTVKKEWKEKASKFEMYYTFSEPLKRVAAHRLLAIRRGTSEKVISWKMDVDIERCQHYLEGRLIKQHNAPFLMEIKLSIRDSLKRLILPSIEKECFNLRSEEAEIESITVFSKNIKTILLAPPVGPEPMIGVDPGFRTGCKCGVIDRTGAFKENWTMFPNETKKRDHAKQQLIEKIKQYAISYIAIGNGTASKETEQFVKAVIKDAHLEANVVMVNESGASIYSASDLAREEFPELDLTVRGAISIARRLQDPLAELIKIDPKSIGVGQYQHDVNQKELKDSLDFVVEYCVNHVGVNLETASETLLSHVAGIGPLLAKNIIKKRAEVGGFSSRKQLKDVPKLGAKAFQQCAGFLRVPGGDNPLDNSAIHPESYSIVKKMALVLGLSLRSLIGNHSLLDQLDLTSFVTESIGLPTLKDIVTELKKPGRDPRESFSQTVFREDINSISDLVQGMVVPGIVTNVTNFGAFVDIGVHQDGLIHISKLSKTFVKDPNDIISVGESVSVKVLEADEKRKRISLEKI